MAGYIEAFGIHSVEAIFSINFCSVVVLLEERRKGESDKDGWWVIISYPAQQ